MVLKVLTPFGRLGRMPYEGVSLAEIWLSL